MKYRVNVKKAIKVLCAMQGITVAELADRAGYHRTSVYAWFRRDIGMSTLCVIANAFGVTPDEVVRRGMEIVNDDDKESGNEQH